MKRILYITLAAVVAASFSAKAQNSNSTMYFMDQYTQRMGYNAAFTPGAGYLGLPALGGMSLGLASSIGPGDLLYNVNGKMVTILHKDVPHSALDNLGSHMTLDQNMELNVISFGFYVSKKRNAFVSFNSNLRQRAYMSIPSDFIVFLKRGQHGDPTYLDFSDLKVGGQVVLENALGLSMDVNKNLRVGARVKYLIGGANVEMNYHNFSATLSRDAWIIRSEGRMNAHLPGDLNPGLDENGAVDWNFDNWIFDNEKDGFSFAGSGLGVDLGATYTDFLVPRLTVSLAINDIGTMSWRNSMNAAASGEMYFYGVTDLGGESGSQFDQLGDDLEDMVTFYPTQKGAKSSQWLDTNMRLSGEYGIFQKNNRDLLSAGLSYFGYLNSPVKYHEFMVAATYRPASWFTLSGNIAKPIGYDFSYGMAMMFSGVLNFYVAANIGSVKFTSGVPIPMTNVSTNVQMGLNFRIGGKRI